MMDRMSVTLELVGVYAGATAVFNGHQFIQGRCELTGQPEQIGGAIRYLGRTYNAHPIGTKEHEAAVAQYKAAMAEKEGSKDGSENDANPSAESGQAAQVPSESDEAGGLQEAEDVSSEGDVGTEDGDSGLRPAGDGHEDSGDADQSEKVKGEVDPKLVEVIYSLDPDNDDHWVASTGAPKVTAVQSGYGANVLKADIQAAAPGYDRNKARQRQSEVTNSEEEDLQDIL